jgi:RNA polymerase sigma factor (sigma-70 family)
VNELAALVEKAAAGDLEAFGILVRRFQDMACGYAYSVLRDFQAAEDVAQEAFLEAYQCLKDLREPLAFPSWLRRIVYKHCDRRFRGKRIETVSIEGTEAAANPSERPDRQTEARELQAKVLDAINGLSDVQREATTLFYMNGYSEKEVAEFLEVPVSTVKKRLHDSRRKLKEAMVSMVGDTLKQHAPDERFARKVADAVALCSTKGPARDHVFSEWNGARGRQIGDLAREGEEGFRIAVALSRSERRQARAQAAVYFGMTLGDRSAEQLAILLRDRCADVRRRAVSFYAKAIHPEHDYYSQPASSVPQGVEKLYPLIDDHNVAVRRRAVMALRAYAGLAHAPTLEALGSACRDPKHKIRHEAWRALGKVCPDCGGK